MEIVETVVDFAVAELVVTNYVSLDNTIVAIPTVANVTTVDIIVLENSDQMVEIVETLSTAVAEIVEIVVEITTFGDRIAVTVDVVVVDVVVLIINVVLVEMQVNSVFESTKMVVVLVGVANHNEKV